MSKTTTVRARIEPRLKKEAEHVLGDLGLSATQAITLFYTGKSRCARGFRSMWLFRMRPREGHSKVQTPARTSWFAKMLRICSGSWESKWEPRSIIKTLGTYLSYLTSLPR